MRDEGLGFFALFCLRSEASSLGFRVYRDEGVGVKVSLLFKCFGRRLPVSVKEFVWGGSKVWRVSGLGGERF